MIYDKAFKKFGILVDRNVYRAVYSFHDNSSRLYDK